MVWLLLAAPHTPRQRKTDGTRMGQGLGNDTEPSLWLQSQSLGWWSVPAPWQRSARAHLHAQP